MTAEHLAIENYSCSHCRAVFRTAFQRCPLDGNLLEPLVGDPLSGTSFADRYIIEECVGEGGMGRVYRARHQRMSRLFAVKVLFGDHAADQKMQARLAREAEAASRLSHPNVISVLDFGETEAGLLYLVMDYVDGPTLAQLIEQQAPFSAQRVRKLVRDMARGLAHAHKRGLIHRDFKADNVIIGEDGGSEGAEERAKIVDFGIAMLNEPNKSRKLTTEGMVLGTPAVMAPEQAVGENVDHRTDLFSLGIVIYEMLCGKLPFDGTPLEIAQQNLASTIPAISQRVPGLYVDPGLEAMAARLMEKRPDDRFQSANDVLRELSLLEGDNSREFVRTEGRFLADAGLDPVTPAPAPIADSVAPMRAQPSAPGYLSASQKFAGTPAPGATAMLEHVDRARRNRVWVVPLLAVAVVAAVVGLVVFSSSNSEPGEAGALAMTEETQPEGVIPSATDDDPPATEDDPPATDDDPPATEDDPPATEDDPSENDDDPSATDNGGKLDGTATNPVVADNQDRPESRRETRKERRRRDRLERKRLEREQRRLEAIRKADDTANSKAPEAEPVTMGQFERALRQATAAVNELGKVNKDAVRVMRSRLGQLQSSYGLAASDQSIRKKFIGELRAIRRKARSKLASLAKP